MSFHLNNAAFIDDLTFLTRNVGRDTFHKHSPKALYHYTHESSLVSIIQHRQFWATCVTEQSDLTELTHGIALTEQLVLQMLDKETCSFTRRVLTEIPDVMRTRRAFIFIVCFCGSESSRFHWENYGEFCLRCEIPPAWQPKLKCADTRAESWYSPVIYGESEQRRAAKRFLNGLVLLIRKYTQGKPDGLALTWMAKGVARDAGQCLLTLVACFKRKQFVPDAEWRLIFCPNLAPSSSAPAMADESFAPSIVTLPKRHICLSMDDGATAFGASKPLQVPFQDLTYFPTLLKPGSLARVKTVIDCQTKSISVGAANRHWWDRLREANS